ncbi:MAG: oligosaccharide repeat unit polymerase, partial [Colwellia sp.]|nr:oligosaccharide repeat unit polymerase [Colwellia sp.]
AFNRTVNIPIYTLLFLFINCSLIHVTYNLLSRALAVIWLWWLVIGVFFSAAHSIVYSGENIDIERACFIHLLFLFSFQCGVLLIEKKEKCINVIIEFKSSFIFGIGILIYPYIMFAESFLKIGYIPMLQGGNIVDDMYTINYGKLYNYKIIVLFSILYAAHILVHSSTSIKRTLYCLILSSYFFISLFDGKRVIFLAGMIILTIYFFKIYGLTFIKRWVGIFFSVLIFVYSSIASLRGGGARDFEGIHRFFLAVGVEFKDFAWTVTHFEPFTIPNYSWLASSLGSFINGFFLSIIDIDKNDLVHMDSARAWMDIYGIELGIRTGLISELWFEFGYFGLCVIFLFGIFLTKLTSRIYNEKVLFKFSFYSLLYAYLLMAIMGQSSLLFGVAITAIYLYFAWIIVNKLDPILRGEA